jgi:hypothetical protein
LNVDFTRPEKKDRAKYDSLQLFMNMTLTRCSGVFDSPSGVHPEDSEDIRDSCRESKSYSFCWNHQYSLQVASSFWTHQESICGKGSDRSCSLRLQFAKRLKSSSSPSFYSPINFQNMIKICGTLTVTVNDNNFFLAGSSSLSIHQYLNETGEEVSLMAEGRNCFFKDKNVGRVA